MTIDLPACSQRSKRYRTQPYPDCDLRGRTCCHHWQTHTKVDITHRPAACQVHDRLSGNNAQLHCCTTRVRVHGHTIATCADPLSLHGHGHAGDAGSTTEARSDNIETAALRVGSRSHNVLLHVTHSTSSVVTPSEQECHTSRNTQQTQRCVRAETRLRSPRAPSVDTSSTGNRIFQVPQVIAFRMIQSCCLLHPDDGHGTASSCSPKRYSTELLLRPTRARVRAGVKILPRRQYTPLL